MATQLNAIAPQALLAADPDSPPAVENVVDVRELSVGYGERTALEQVSFTLAPGDVLAVVGPGGAGKSSLVRALTGQLPEDAWSLGSASCASFAFLPQERRVGLNLEPTVGPGRTPRADWRVLRLREVMAASARVKILDEPDANLEDEHLARVHSQLDQTSPSDALLIVTHSLRVARRFATRILLLVEGRIVEQGPAADFFESPKTERGRIYLTTGS